MDVAGYDGTAAFQTMHQKDIIDQKLPRWQGSIRDSSVGKRA